jgi:hypothetical protein
VPTITLMKSRRLIASPKGLGQKDRTASNEQTGRGERYESPCPLWVISGHMQCTNPCPLYPQ